MILSTSLGLHSFTTTSETLNTQASHLNNELLQGLIEVFFDGILILTEQGECIQANNLTRQICLQLIQTKSKLNSVPKFLWALS